MPFKIVRNDITEMQVDAIVNPANQSATYSTGVDAAVYKKAGKEKLLQARKEIGFLNEGEVAITPGFALPVKYIIHAVSPLYIDGTYGEADLLRSCYEKSLQLALEKQCESIAFPLIATGNFGYPRDEGLEIALNIFHKFLMKEDMMIYLVVFDNETVRLSGMLYDEIETYIDQAYVVEQQIEEYGQAWDEALSESLVTYSPKENMLPMMSSARPPGAFQCMQKSETVPRSLDNIMDNLGETFQQRLFRLIDERGKTDVEVYKGAGKDKKLFHKIRSNQNYQPSKHTVFAFALSLELSLDETKDLLASAGYAFSPSSRFDNLMHFVIENKIYNIQKVDGILFDFQMEQYFSCEK